VRLIDSHCHLQADRFDADVDLVLESARRAGVERILVPAWDRPSAEGALALAERHRWLDAAVGVHPHDAANVDQAAWEWFTEVATDPHVVAIGETGLDFDRAFSAPDAQLRNLRRNLRLAIGTGKPAILHCRSAVGRRDAQDALLVELREAGFDEAGVRARFEGRPPAILHSFSGPVDYAEAAIAMGLAVSFSGLVFRPGEEASADVAALVPSAVVLVETDSPFLSPPGAPRRRNGPEWVSVTARWVADRRAEDPERLGEDLVANYERILGTSRAVQDGTPGR
jgi:TatD DNase family protein